MSSHERHRLPRRLCVRRVPRHSWVGARRAARRCAAASLLLLLLLPQPHPPPTPHPTAPRAQAAGRGLLPARHRPLRAGLQHLARLSRLRRRPDAVSIPLAAQRRGAGVVRACMHCLLAPPLLPPESGHPPYLLPCLLGVVGAAPANPNLAQAAGYYQHLHSAPRPPPPGPARPPSAPRPLPAGSSGTAGRPTLCGQSPTGPRGSPA